jgi:hypothetical protein
VYESLYHRIHQEVKPQFQQLSSNRRKPLSLAWPQFPQPCLLVVGSVGGGAAFQGGNRAGPSVGSLGKLSCLGGGSAQGPLEKLAGGPAAAYTPCAQSLLHCELATQSSTL